MSQFFSQGNDRRDESQQDEGKKNTTPSNKSKSRRTCKGEEDHEEEEKNKEPSEDIYMDSQKEEEDRIDVEMQSQNLESDHSDPEETKEKKDERAPSPECRRREERSTEGDQQCEDGDSAVDSEESRSGSAKDKAEAKSPATQMVTVGAAQDKESPAAAVDSTEMDNSAEPMEDEGVEGDPSTKEKLPSEEDVEVEMKTQGGDTQEAELTPADCCQSKDGFGSPDGP
ncbi:hypothetical protein GJAV_G00237860 [Gymnothorax javanicus]|nr:hypothetical protein GJAV_G00237860 [Gymnothorax javanicus]